jgi:hypothetical protein
MRAWTGCQRLLRSIAGTACRFNRYDERCRITCRGPRWVRPHPREILRASTFGWDSEGIRLDVALLLAAEDRCPWLADRKELIEAYYGLPVPDLSLYVGFAQPEMFDVPLLTTGLEHLYLTLDPSPDLTRRQLLEILYDHPVTRRAAPVHYDNHSPEAELETAEYNERCKGKTLGIGRVDTLTGLWRPLLPKLTYKCRHESS